MPFLTSLLARKQCERIVPVLLNWSQVRFRKPVEFRKYRQPNFRQKLLLAVCEPVYASPTSGTAEKCSHLRLKAAKPDHPYDVLLAKDMANELEQSQLVCIFHLNQMKLSERRIVSNEIEHENMILRFYNRDIVRICVENTIYRPLLNFVAGYQYPILFAPDFSKVAKILEITKKYSQLILLAGLVEKRRLITFQQLAQLAHIAHLDNEKSLLLHTLSMGQQSLMSTLNYHTSQLQESLKRHENHLKN